MSFEEDLVQAVKSKAVKEIHAMSLLKMTHEDMQALPKGFVESVWKEINWDAVLLTVRDKMQTRICNSIVGSMETEIKTDVKKLMSVDGVRDKIRMTVYPELMKVLNEA